MKSMIATILMSTLMSASALAKTTYVCKVTAGKTNSDAKPNTSESFEAPVLEFDVEENAKASANVVIPRTKYDLRVEIYREFDGDEFLHYAFMLNASEVQPGNKYKWIGQTNFYSDVLPGKFEMNLLPFYGKTFFWLQCKR